MQDNSSRSVDYDSRQMTAIWQRLAGLTQTYRDQVSQLPVSPHLDLNELRQTVESVDFAAPRPWQEVFDWLDHHMRHQQLHSGHPRYFGLFNPAPLPLGIAADALTAAYNPQLAAWSHSPFANELERHLIHHFGLKFGLPEDSIDGSFCSGGAEANHAALLCALTAKYPDFPTSGVRLLKDRPALYISEIAHHSWIKASRSSGLGTVAVRRVPCDSAFRLDVTRLNDLIKQDKREGCRPVLICGTAGTTSAGTIDPLDDLAQLARTWNCWYHVDAAWGGAARLVPQFAHWLTGIEKSDSITFDAHKFLSIPMGAGLFLTRHKEILSSAFAISTDYMPSDASSLNVIEPYSHSMQWSRRFIGLKLFLPLAVAGWTGFANLIRSQCQLGDRLKHMLTANGWRVLNETPLPIVCFTHASDSEGLNVEAIAKKVVESGAAWISTVKLNRPALRACITNFRSTESDLTRLIQLLDNAQIAIQSRTSPAFLLNDTSQQ